MTSNGAQNLAADTSPTHQTREEAREPVVPTDLETAAAGIDDTIGGDTDAHELIDPDDEQPPDAPAQSRNDDAVAPKDRPKWKRTLARGFLPGFALLLALGAGYLQWQDSSIRADQVARIESTQAAKDAAVHMLSYRPDTVDKDLGAARELLTGDFKNSYTSLTNDVVIPGAKQKQISAVASVPAVASISANSRHAEAVVFVDQTIIVGNDAPTSTNSRIKVTLEKIDGRWLVSKFDPV